MPLTISRGMSSLPPKKAIHDRYIVSQKRKLILLIVSDLDPAGVAIAEDLVKSFRRDFGIEEIEAYKVALTIDQVREFNLAPSMEAKDTITGRKLVNLELAIFVSTFEFLDDSQAHRMPLSLYAHELVPPMIMMMRSRCRARGGCRRRRRRSRRIRRGHWRRQSSISSCKEAEAKGSVQTRIAFT
jgi:hypothetical protein